MRIRIKIKYIDILRIIVSMLPLLVYSGCQKVINVDLNNAAPRIVIEGLISDRRGPYTITITKSGSYFNQPVLTAVSDAKVTITDNTGTSDTLRESGPGIYVTTKTRGIAGRTYTLKVLSDNIEYQGTSTMLDHVDIDSLTLVRSEFQRIDFGGNNQNRIHYDIHCFFSDPPQKNYYRFKVFKNDSINTQSYRLYDDQYTNGEETELRVSSAEAGSTYRIELQSIDQATYGYYRTLADLIFSNPLFGSTPANPNTNLSNGSLGYFGAAAVSTKTIVITDLLINSVK
jgi:hypothetical protein